MQKKNSTQVRSMRAVDVQGSRNPFHTGLIGLLVYVLFLTSCFSQSGTWLLSLGACHSTQTIQALENGSSPIPCFLGERTIASVWTSRTLRFQSTGLTVGCFFPAALRRERAAFSFSLGLFGDFSPRSPYAQRNRHLQI